MIFFGPAVAAHLWRQVDDYSARRARQPREGLPSGLFRTAREIRAVVLSKFFSEPNGEKWKKPLAEEKYVFFWQYLPIYLVPYQSNTMVILDCNCFCYVHHGIHLHGIAHYFLTVSGIAVHTPL